MPLVAFVDETVIEELKKINTSEEKNKELFPEHEFLAACLRMGLKIEDLKILTYVDVYKIFISLFNSEEKEEKEESGSVRQATQEDIKNIVARM